MLGFYAWGEKDFNFMFLPRWRQSLNASPFWKSNMIFSSHSEKENILRLLREERQNLGEWEVRIF